MRLFSILLAGIFLLSGCSTDDETHIADLETSYFKTSINHKGEFTHFTDVASGRDYMNQDTSSVIMSIRRDSVYYHPLSAKLDGLDLILEYENDIVAKIKIEEKKSHLTFELAEITKKDSIDLIVWGPYQSRIDKIIGETVGVVRGDNFALGIQALNIKTLGGYPWNESDRMPPINIFEQEDPNDMNPENAQHVLYRVEAAKPTRRGSSLQAYCRNRHRSRIIQDFNHEKILAPPYDDGGISESRIALFGCPSESTLDIIEKIEITEGLPHPTIDGEWVKTSPYSSASYIIMNFSGEDLEKALDVTKKAGLKYLYYYGKAFESWGHFELFREQFPNGYPDLKKYVDIAEAAGIRLGTHTLSNFITTNDPYVTPIPDKRLAIVGSARIVDDVNKTQTEIAIDTPFFFNQMKNNTLKTVRINDELIRYGSVSRQAPWMLLDCQRGAFNTIAGAHGNGDEISKLLDHAYKVFLSNADLTIEISKRLAVLYNETGLRQISFDGLEGNRSTGLGTYGESLMPYTWYNHLSQEIKEHLIIDASRTTHFFWHIYTRMNWGEPWYAGFRESQTEYRLKNQAYFQRNFMPGMLGWFLMTPETSVEDIEWLLARSAGFDAGFAFVTGFDAIEQNGDSEKILALIKRWENLRLSDRFTESQKKAMQDPKKEFTLIDTSEGNWILHDLHSEKFTHEKKVRQPGEPLHSKFKFKNIFEEQGAHFMMKAADADVSNIVLEFDKYKEIKFPISLKKGQTLKYSGGSTALVFDSNWNKISELNVNEADFKIAKGDHEVSIDCKFKNAGDKPILKLEIRMLGDGEALKPVE